MHHAYSGFRHRAVPSQIPGPPSCPGPVAVAEVCLAVHPVSMNLSMPSYQSRFAILTRSASRWFVVSGYSAVVVPSNTSIPNPNPSFRPININSFPALFAFLSITLCRLSVDKLSRRLFLSLSPYRPHRISLLSRAIGGRHSPVATTSATTVRSLLATVGP